jgi:hypothetical protein
MNNKERIGDAIDVFEKVLMYFEDQSGDWGWLSQEEKALREMIEDSMDSLTGVKDDL